MNIVFSWSHITTHESIEHETEADFCPATGEKFDQFQIQKLLGCGYFGKCFTVTKEDEPDKIMVLKVSDSFPNKQYFETELEVLRSLPVTHHFPSFISTFTIEDRLDCIVMTYQGICLKTMLEQNENKKFTLENTLRIGMQLMECVELLHACGWFHRDIHIENVTVNTDSGGNLKLTLIDFGISISTNTPIDDRCLCKYPLIEDYVSVVEVLKLCSIIQEAETGAKPDWLPSKEKLPCDYKWLRDLYNVIEEQKGNNYNNEIVKRFIRNVRPSFDTKSDITFTEKNGEKIIE